MRQYYAIVTRANSEANTIRRLARVIDTYGMNVYSMIFNPEVKGYIFIECENRDDLPKLIKEVKTAKRILRGVISEEEYLNMATVEYEPLKVGDIVNITGGPFKNLEGTVVNIDDGKVVLYIKDLEHLGQITMSRGDVVKQDG